MAKENKSKDSVYRITEVIGTSTKSWEDAAQNAVETASATLRDLRIAEVVKQDLKIEQGKGARVLHAAAALVQLRKLKACDKSRVAFNQLRNSTASIF